MFSKCSLLATSGTTPPYLVCTSICELIIVAISSWPFLIILTLVSSQDDSTSKIYTSLIISPSP